MASNASRIWGFFKSKGMNEYGIAGLMGNLYYESALDPKNLQGTYERSLGYTDSSYTKAVDNGTYTEHQFVHDSAGYGLAQWTYYSRKQNLYDYAKQKDKSIGDLEMQCAFLYKELKHSYSSVFDTLENAKSVREASDKVLHSFEKPANQSTSVEQNRANKGNEYYKKFKGTDGTKPNTTDDDYDEDVTVSEVALKDLVDLETMYQYVITVDRNTKRKIDFKAISKQLNVRAAMVEGGYLFDKNHNRVKYFANPKLKSQISALADSKIPWALYMISRAKSQKEALEEINEFYYVLNEWTPELGAWIIPEWKSTSVSINDKMLDAMYEKLKQFGFIGKVGLYATKSQVEKTSWKRHCLNWLLWWNYHTEVKEYVDEVVTPEFFMLNDGKNNPQPVTIVGRSDDDDTIDYKNPDPNWKKVPEKNGSNVNYYNDNSDMLILGDSRNVQMYNEKRNASFTAVWGGHYGGTAGYVINSDNNIAKAKGSIKRIGEAKGSVRIFVVATVNAYTGGSHYEGPVKNQLYCAQQLYNYAKANKIEATVFCCSLIAEKGGDVSRYNKRLKELVDADKKYKYLNIKPDVVKYSDSAHFKSETSKQIFKIMARAK